MLFMGDKSAFGISGYGPVCKGTGKNAIDFRIKKKSFANMVCNSMGFAKAEFIGLKNDYAEFMKQKNLRDQGIFFKLF